MEYAPFMRVTVLLHNRVLALRRKFQLCINLLERPAETAQVIDSHLHSLD